MKNKLWIVLVIIALPIIYFSAAKGIPPPPPGGDGAPASSNAAVGPVIPGLYNKNAEVAHSGWVTKVSDDYIEIVCKWCEPIRVEIGPETLISGGKLAVGQLVQVIGIYPENGGPFTTNYTGYLFGMEQYPRRGTIQIIG